MQRMTNSGSSGMVRCTDPLDHPNSLSCSCLFPVNVRQDSGVELVSCIVAASGVIQYTLGIFQNVRYSTKQTCETYVTAWFEFRTPILLTIFVFYSYFCVLAVIIIINILFQTALVAPMLCRHYRVRITFSTIRCYLISQRLGILYLFWNFVIAVFKHPFLVF